MFLIISKQYSVFLLLTIIIIFYTTQDILVNQTFYIAFTGILRHILYLLLANYNWVHDQFVFAPHLIGKRLHTAFSAAAPDLWSVRRGAPDPGCGPATPAAPGGACAPEPDGRSGAGKSRPGTPRRPGIIWPGTA